MPTLLSLANRVLLNIGERPLLNLDTTMGLRVRDALAESLNEVETLYDWGWLNSYVTPSSWVLNRATVTDVQRIRGVYYRQASTANQTQLQYVEPEVFNFPYPSALPSTGGVPEAYTIVGNSDIYVHPYPNTVTQQNLVIVDAVLWVYFPNNANTEITNIPPQYLDLVVLRASAKMAVRQLGDAGVASSFNNEYEALAQRMRDRYRNSPTSGTNMYKGFRNRHYGR